MLLTVELEPSRATLSEVKKALHLSDSDIDDEFGVVSVDPDAGLYAVLVEEPAAAAAASHPGVKGPFSNPRIEPFGPLTAD